jgi:hypothetical protein
MPTVYARGWPVVKMQRPVRYLLPSMFTDFTCRRHTEARRHGGLVFLSMRRLQLIGSPRELSATAPPEPRPRYHPGLAGKVRERRFVQPRGIDNAMFGEVLDDEVDDSRSSSGQTGNRSLPASRLRDPVQPGNVRTARAPETPAWRG